MKSRVLWCVLFLSTVFSLFGASEEWLPGPNKNWYINYEEALEAAKKENKKIFVLQTGSDWCGYCKQLYRNVLRSSTFRDYARKNFILVYIDLPRRKNMPQDQLNYNRNLVKQLKFGGGVPSVVILDHDGKESGRISGYLPAKKYMEKLQSIVN